MLVRTIECLDGSVEVELVCEPAFDYGRVPAEWTLVGDDAHAADATGAGQTFRLSTDMLIGVEGGSARARHVLHKGEKAYCALSWAEGLARRRTWPTRRRGSTRPSGSGATGWRGPGSPTTGYRHPLERSALTIKGLTYMPTGATVAALTTSLPETRVANATGTTATPGCGTPPSPCRRCTT